MFQGKLFASRSIQRPHLNLVRGQALSHALENAQNVWVITVNAERLRRNVYLAA